MKEQFEFYKTGVLNKLEKLEKDIQILRGRLSTTIVSLQTLELIDRKIGGIVQSAEQITLAARSIPAAMGLYHGEELSNAVTLDNADMRLGFTEQGWFYIDMPPIPPRKANPYDVRYIRDTLVLVLQKFFTTLPRDMEIGYEDCVFIYRHIVPNDIQKIITRDNDNYEYKVITDCISCYLVHDDSPFYTDQFNCTVQGDVHRTQVFTVPRKDFAQFLGLHYAGESII